MARYKDIDVILDNLPDDLPYKASVKRVLIQAPTADVVPKSEVDRFQTEIKVLTENSISAKYPHCVLCSNGAILTKSLKDYDKLIGDISSSTQIEVASEIFEEIEAVLNKIFEEYAVLGQADCCMITEIIRRKLSAELKKKYTESEGKE